MSPASVFRLFRVFFVGANGIRSSKRSLPLIAPHTVYTAPALSVAAILCDAPAATRCAHTIRPPTLHFSWFLPCRFSSMWGENPGRAAEWAGGFPTRLTKGTGKFYIKNRHSLPV